VPDRRKHNRNRSAAVAAAACVPLSQDSLNKRRRLVLRVAIMLLDRASEGLEVFASRWHERASIRHSYDGESNAGTMFGECEEAL